MLKNIHIQFWTNWSSLDYIVNVSKIAIIVFVAFVLFTQFIPWYIGSDSVVYGLTGAHLLNGFYGHTNELLQETGRVEFVPNQWVKTIHNSAVPLMAPGFPVLIATALFVGGDYALLFLPAFIMILFFVAAERIATKLFGKYIGLFTLVLMASSSLIMNHGKLLLTEGAFSLFFIIGFYYLMRALRDERGMSIFLSSLFFSVATLIRSNGMIIFPIEIILISGLFILNFVKKEKDQRTLVRTSKNSSITSQMFKENNLKKIGLMLLPWIFVILFWLSFNMYFFGDPLTHIYSSFPDFPIQTSDIGTSSFQFLEVDENRITKSGKYFWKLMPNFLVQPCYDLEIEYCVNKIVFALSSFLLLISALLISLIKKRNRVEIIGCILLIFTFVFFFSSNSIAAFSPRFMIPIFPLIFMSIGFLIFNFIYPDIIKNQILKKYEIHNKSIIIVMLAFFLMYSGYIISETNSYKTLEKFAKNGFNFKNPELYNKIQDNPQGMSPNSVFVKTRGSAAVHFGVIPFNAFPNITIRDGFELSDLKTDTVELLKKIMYDGYNVYVKKNPRVHAEFDESFKRVLIQNHDMHMKDFSRTFCKLELNLAGSDNSTDEVCIGTFYDEFMEKKYNKTTS